MTEKSELQKDPPRVLTIAGSDSGGGAGIQADLKTMTVLNTYGMSVITAVTAQNTLGVQAVRALSPEFVKEQLDSVFSDLHPEAGKTGMLADADIVQVVADKLSEYDQFDLVVDPVMVATSGDLLLAEEAVETVRQKLLPQAAVITPNLQEARILLYGQKEAKKEFSPDELTAGEERDLLAELARGLFELGPEAVLVKGGHLGGDEAFDLLFDGEKTRVFSAPRLPSNNTHGTGCTYSAAIAAYLARELELEAAVAKSKEFITSAIRTGFELGAGIDPVNHLAAGEEVDKI